MDVVDALGAMKKPIIRSSSEVAALKLMNKAGLAGEMMTTSMQAVEPRRHACPTARRATSMRSAAWSSVAAGRRDGSAMATWPFSRSMSVSVGSMDVAPGEADHMDENGAVVPTPACPRCSEERPGDAG